MLTEKLNLRQKLASIYAAISHVDKYGSNTTQHYTYVRAADVLHTLRKALSALNVYAATNYTLLGTYDIKTNKGGIMHTATVKADIVFMDTESNETISVSGLGDGADSGDKGIYKAQTGATKNALRNAFLVPDEADPEADASVDEATTGQYDEPEPASRRQISKPAVLAAPYSAETKVSQVPRAEIPQNFEDVPSRIPDNGNKPAAEPIQKTRNAKVSLPAVEMPAGGVIPTAQELEKYRARAVELYDRLKGAGLKPSRGKSIPAKVLAYLLQTTSAEDALKITTLQWDTFFQYVDQLLSTDNGGKLVDLVNEASKG